MKLGIIGPPQSGKTTLFNAVSGKMEAVGDYSRAVHKAVIKVPDERLDNLVTLQTTKKVTHAEIEFLDAAGFTGKGKKSGKDTDIMADLRLMDALVVVIDQYSPDTTPEADLQAMLDEMILADMVIIENNVDKLERTLKLTGKNERARELEVLKKCQTALENETPLSEIGLTLDDKKEVRGYAFLTLKPILITFNISEDMLSDYNKIYEGYKKYRQDGIREISVICGKIEMELAAISVIPTRLALALLAF